MLIAGNWKLHKGPAEAGTFARSLAATLDGVTRADVAVCPPYVSLAEVGAALAGSDIAVYAQNAHWQEAGAFTGEVAPGMLLELGAQGTLVGHSERRQYFGETDESVARRAAHALEQGLTVIACVGELEEERDAGETEEVLRRQVEAVAEATGAHARLLLAYEPVWAIGTGRTATTAQAEEAHAFLRSILDVPILYGGSVKPENAGELLALADVDGALVGGASLEVDSFAQICRSTPATSS